MSPTRPHKPKAFQRDYLTARVACEEEGLAVQSIAYAIEALRSKEIVGELASELFRLGMYDKEGLVRVQARVEELRGLELDLSVASTITSHVRRELFRRTDIGPDEIAHILLYVPEESDDGSGLLKSLRNSKLLTGTEARRIRSQARAKYYRYALKEFLGLEGQESSTDSLPYWIRDGWELGDFEFHEELGRGNMGIVFRAHQRSLDRLVALKVISPRGQDDERLIRFRREVQNLARLQHDNIVSIYKVGHIGTLYYLSMQIIEGASLSRRIEEDNLPLQQGIEIVRDIARALDHAHRLGVLHRDVKPANILLDPNGVPYLTDFGLAKTIGSDQTITREGEQVGTPYYMAPEQVIGRASQIGPCSDVYSLGVVLYEVVTGRRPFTGDSIIQVYHAITRTDPAHPSRVSQDIQEPLGAIIMKSIARQPEDRYRSASAFSHDLNCYLLGRPIQARPPSIIVRTLQGAGQWHSKWVVGIVLAVTVALFAGIHFWKNAHPDPQATTSSAPPLDPDTPSDRQKTLNALTDSHLAQGENLFEGANHEQARACFEQALRLDDKNPRAHFQLGRTLRALGQDEEALQSFGRALHYQPGLVAAWVETARCHIEQSRHQNAQRALLEAIRIDESWVEAHRLLAMTAFRLHDSEEAVRHLSRVIELDPLSSEAHYLRARIHIDTNRLQAARMDLDEAIRLQPHHAQAYFERARLQEKRGRLAEAIRDYERSLTSRPNHSRAPDARKRIESIRTQLGWR